MFPARRGNGQPEIQSGAERNRPHSFRLERKFSYTCRMSEIIQLADYRRTGPEAVHALLGFELAPGISVHSAAWLFAMPEAEYQQCNADPEQMASLLDTAGLAYFSGNDDQPAALVLHDERRFCRHFRTLACREAAMDALGSGILIRREIEHCA